MVLDIIYTKLVFAAKSLVCFIFHNKYLERLLKLGPVLTVLLHNYKTGGKVASAYSPVHEE